MTFLDIWAKSESADQDSIKVKRIYIDICGNLTDGVLFSQIMYWHGFNPKTGKRRLQVYRDGHWWLAKRYEDWYEECRINASTARDSIRRMVDLNLLEKRLFHFSGKPMVHIRVIPEQFQSLIDKVMADNETAQSSLNLRNPSNANDEIRTLDTTESVDSYTETTTETTSQTTEDQDLAPAAQGEPVSEFKQVQTVVIDKWFDGDWQNAGWAGKLAKMFMGVSEDKTYQEFNFDPPMDAKQVSAWAAWMATKLPEMPTTLEKLMRWKSKFMAETAPTQADDEIVDYGGGGFAEVTARTMAWYASQEGKDIVRAELDARGIDYDPADF